MLITYTIKSTPIICLYNHPQLLLKQQFHHQQTLLIRFLLRISLKHSLEYSKFKLQIFSISSSSTARSRIDYHIIKIINKFKELIRLNLPQANYYNESLRRMCKKGALISWISGINMHLQALVTGLGLHSECIMIIII